MYRLRYLILFIIITVISYGAINAVVLPPLSDLGWGQLKSPRYVIPEKPFVVDISYKKIPHASRLVWKAHFRDAQKKYLGMHHYREPISEIGGSGQKTFELSMHFPENAAEVQLKVALPKPPNEKSSGKQVAEQGASSLSSAWIPVCRGDETVCGNRASITSLVRRAFEKGYWKEHRGDYTVAGWSITVLYALCLVVLLYLLKSCTISARHERIFWSGTALVVFFLLINKQLDIQILMTDIARTVAKEYQLYELRKPYQLRVVAFGAALAIAFFVTGASLCRKAQKGFVIALTGLFLLMTFVLLRAVSHHVIEDFFVQRYGGYSRYDLIEMMGIVIVLVAAGLTLKNSTYR